MLLHIIIQTTYFFIWNQVSGHPLWLFSGHKIYQASLLLLHHCTKYFLLKCMNNFSWLMCVTLLMRRWSNDHRGLLVLDHDQLGDDQLGDFPPMWNKSLSNFLLFHRKSSSFLVNIAQTSDVLNTWCNLKYWQTCLYFSTS